MLRPDFSYFCYMSRIYKSTSFGDIPSYDKEYWWAKTPEERLEAALKLIRFAKAIYRSNPGNPDRDNGTRIFKSDQPVQRRKG